MYFQSDANYVKGGNQRQEIELQLQIQERQKDEELQQEKVEL